MKKYFLILGSIQAFIAIGAIPAAIKFLTDTSGSSMGTSTALLANSPFSTFLIPALFLLIFNGFGNVAGAILSFLKKQVAGTIGLILGIILSIWIFFQIKWIGFNSFLQLTFLVIGLVEAYLGWKIRGSYRHAE